jgi:hypothetical protein
MGWFCPICKLELEYGYNRRFANKHLFNKHKLRTTTWSDEELMIYGGMIKKKVYFTKENH